MFLGWTGTPHPTSATLKCTAQVLIILPSVAYSGCPMLAYSAGIGTWPLCGNAARDAA
jgi:hypothetical protein